MRVCVAALVCFALFLAVGGQPARHHRHNPNGTNNAHAPFHCDGHVADQLASQFVSLRYDGSACPKEDWLPLMARADPESDKILVNVGFNKGYNFAVWMAIFSPWVNITAGKWGSMVCPNATDSDCCGVCQDCKMEFPSLRPHHRGHGHSSLKHPQITMIGLEINEQNVQRANATMAKVLGEDTQNSSVRLFPYFATLSNKVEARTIRRCVFGDEGCGLGSHGARTLPQVVNTTTVDLFMEEFSAEHSAYLLEHHSKKVIQFPHQFSKIATPTSHSRHYLIDMLMIDVEGYDAKVLEGTHGLLAQQAIRALIFEYHSKPPWNGIHLEEVVRQLEVQNFDCYFQGQGRLWPITSGCWSSRYEFHQWSNVMCVQKGDIWHVAIQPLVHRNVTSSTSNVLSKIQRKGDGSSTPWRSSIGNHHVKSPEEKQSGPPQKQVRAQFQGRSSEASAARQDKASSEKVAGHSRIARLLV